jgi:hypothetical protein
MDRRFFLTGAFGLAVFSPAQASVDALDSALRGTIDPDPTGLRPGLIIDQGPVLQRLIDAAAKEDRLLTLPAGRFVVSNIKLPSGARLAGIPGATRLVLGDGGTMVTADGAELVSLQALSSKAAAGSRTMCRRSSISPAAPMS